MPVPALVNHAPCLRKPVDGLCTNAGAARKFHWQHSAAVLGLEHGRTKDEDNPG